MIIHNVKQGSDEWLDLRHGRFCSSDAAAMKGISPYKKRNELIEELATGISKQPDSFQERIYDDGHEAEAAARIILEAEIGEDFYPVVCGTDDDLYLASLDGFTMNMVLGFEHKLYNKKYAGMIEAGKVPEHLLPQLHHQFLVVPELASIWLVMSDGTKENRAMTEVYRPSDEVLNELVMGWDQLKKDVAAYVPKAKEEAVIQAEVVDSLPAVNVKVDGSVSVITNLDIFKSRLTDFIKSVPTLPQTDSDFMELSNAVKTLRDAEEKLKAVDDRIVSAADIEGVRNEIAAIKEVARQARIASEKLVKDGKDARKRVIVNEGKAKYSDWLNDKIKALGLQVKPETEPDFAAATRGLKTIDSFQNAVDTCLAAAKVSGDSFFVNVAFNKSEITDENRFLFPDLLAVIRKPNDDFKSLVVARESAEKARKEEAEAESRRRVEAAAQAAKAKAEKEAAAQALIAANEAEKDKQRAVEAAKVQVAPVVKEVKEAPIVGISISEKRAKVIAAVNAATDAEISNIYDFIIGGSK